jgi:ketosteroid isomerase-like protein
MNPPMTPSTAAVATPPRTAKVVAFFEALTPETLARLDTVYTEDARFIDPFNDVAGQAGVRRVFEHMFATLDAPRFEIVSALTEGEQCFLLWNFRFRRKGSSGISLIHGSTHVRFAADGRIAWHRDYWDPARELYETVPLLGAVMRWLRRRLSAGLSGESR